MRNQAWAFLLVGFAIGFGVFYTWTKQRAPEVVRAMPLPVDTSVPTAPPNPAEAAPPPVDTAKVAELQNALKTDPKNFNALVELGNLQFDQKKFKESADLYSKALEVKPEENDLRTDLGTAYFYANRFDDSIAEFKKVLQANPTHPQALFNIGVALVHGKNDPQGAVQYWQKLVDTNPTYPQIEIVKQQIKVIQEQLNKK